MRGTKQLALDYFAGQLTGIRNNIKAGTLDPMQPLSDYIAAFQALPDDRVAKLPDFVSLFSTLCDILDYKIQAFKAMVFEIGKDKLGRFYQDPGGVDEVTGIVHWREPVELTTMSPPFITDIMGALGRERRPVPACEVIDDAGEIQARFEMPVNDLGFSQENALIVTCLTHAAPLAGANHVPIETVLDFLEAELGIDRMKAFIHMLHLIQDGDLVLQGGDEPGGIATRPAVRLWRGCA